MKIAYNENCSLRANEWISLSKPALVFGQCYSPELDELVPIFKAQPSQLYLAHDRNYVDAVLQGRKQNGFCNLILSTLEQVLWANGAMIAATREALRSGICFAPVSGFHHAGYDFNGGYCTFNALVMCAALSGKSNVLIIDGDGHYGDGTDDCLVKTGLVSRVRNLTYKYGGVEAREALRDIEKVLNSQRWDLVFYQAGADAHELDDFKVGYLNDEQWRMRDRLIFEHCRETGTPIVWNLAGGYSGTRTINLHYDTFVTACSIYEPDTPRQQLRWASGNSPTGYGSCKVKHAPDRPFETTPLACEVR